MTSDEDAELRRMCGRLILAVDQLVARVEALEQQVAELTERQEQDDDERRDRQH